MDEYTSLISEPLDEDQTQGWIVTYADLVTLLLVFFVLLFSISTMDLAKFKQAIRSIQISMGEESPPIGLLELVEAPEKKVFLEDITGLRPRAQSMMDDINLVIEKKEFGEHIILETMEGKIIIRIKGKILFESGAAMLFDDATPLLDDIIDIIREYGEYNINIKGYTDNNPISTDKFPSNWELSAVRATTMLKYLIKRGVDQSRLTATGYGDLSPIAENDTEEGRAINRRVEFVLEKKAGY